MKWGSSLRILQRGLKANPEITIDGPFLLWLSPKWIDVWVGRMPVLFIACSPIWPKLNGNCSSFSPPPRRQLVPVTSRQTTLSKTRNCSVLIFTPTLAIFFYFFIFILVPSHCMLLFLDWSLNETSRGYHLYCHKAREHNPSKHTPNLYLEIRNNLIPALMSYLQHIN